MNIAQQRKLARLLASDFPYDAQLGVRDREDLEHPFTPRDAVVAIAKAYEMTYEELVGPNREKRYSKPRQIAAAILHSPWFNLSLEETARELNRKDHTSVLYYLERHTEDQTFWETVGDVARAAGISYDIARKRISGGA